MAFTVLVSRLTFVGDNNNLLLIRKKITTDSPESAKRELNLVFEGFEFDAWLQHEHDERKIA